MGEYAEAAGGRLDPDEVAAVFAQILDGLAYAHERGVVHRDLKPGNILICGSAPKHRTPNTEHSVFKIADFGLVRLVGEEWVRSQAELSVKMSMSIGGMQTELPEGAGTSTKSMLGTFEYMSPEQKDGKEATAASDVYSVGMMMYRLLTGKQVGPRPPSHYVKGLVPAWDDLILTALEEDATDRFADAAGMRERLPMEGETPVEPVLVDAAHEDLSASPTRQAGVRLPDRAQQPLAQLPPEPTPPPAPKSPPPTPQTDPTAGNALGMEFVCVETGTFLMGSDQAGTLYNEKPVHDVTLTQPFWIGKYTVTQGEYEKLTGKNPSHFQDEEVLKNGFLGIGREVRRASRPRSPLERVSWHDANNFCKALTDRERRAGRLPEGYVYRLPTEAEWEYAARGGAKSRGYKYSGSNNADEVAWYDNNSGGETHEVGQLKPNELGLYDMSGNVWEWCYDWYNDDFYGRSSKTNPVNTAAASTRVRRGGGWYYSARCCRAAFRSRRELIFTSYILGFRVVLAPSISE